MNPLAVGAAATGVLAVVFFSLWRGEIEDHEATKAQELAERLRANTATASANANALEVTNLKADLILRDAQDKMRDQERAALIAEKNAENLKLKQRLGAYNDALLYRPEVAERAFRIDLNGGMRELSTITCRTNCADEGGEGRDRPTETPRPD